MSLSLGLQSLYQNQYIPDTTAEDGDYLPDGDAPLYERIVRDQRTVIYFAICFYTEMLY